jgi:hypothetical protein
MLLMEREARRDDSWDRDNPERWEEVLAMVLGGAKFQKECTVGHARVSQDIACGGKAWQSVHSHPDQTQQR